MSLCPLLICVVGTTDSVCCDGATRSVDTMHWLLLYQGTIGLSTSCSTVKGLPKYKINRNSADKYPNALKPYAPPHPSLTNHTIHKPSLFTL